MNNEYVGWIIGAVLVVLVVLGVWLLGGDYESSPTASTTPTGEVKTVTAPKSTGGSAPSASQPSPVEKVYSSGLLSINDLLKLQGATYSCTFSLATPYRAGKFYLAEKKWRGDFTNDVSMIDDGKYIYVWSKGASEGLQVVATSAIAGNAIVRQGAVDAYTPISYKCGSWVMDASRFVPPTGIIFKNTEGYILQ